MRDVERSYSEFYHKQMGKIWECLLCNHTNYCLLCFEISAQGGRFIKNLIINHRKKDNTTDEEEIEIQDIFWDKVVPEIVYGVSLVNRVKKLTVQKVKMDLCIIYAFQAKRCFWVASEILNESIYRLSNAKTNQFIFAIGEQPIKWVKETAESYLDEIVKLYEDIDVSLEKEFYKRMRIDVMDSEIRQKK